MIVPVAVVLFELVIVAVNAENVFVIDRDSTIALATPAINSSGANRRRLRGALCSDMEGPFTFGRDRDPISGTSGKLDGSCALRIVYRPVRKIPGPRRKRRYVACARNVVGHTSVFPSLRLTL